jgi:sugar lactone lactonase YvrE
MAFDAAGNLYVADSWNHRIRKISPTASVSTFAGGGDANSCVFSDGRGGSARFCHPTGIVIDFTGSIYVADWGNKRIRKIVPASDDPHVGLVSTFAGGGLGTNCGQNCNNVLPLFL